MGGWEIKTIERPPFLGVFLVHRIPQENPVESVTSNPKLAD